MFYRVVFILMAGTFEVQAQIDAPTVSPFPANPYWVSPPGCKTGRSSRATRLNEDQYRNWGNINKRNIRMQPAPQGLPLNQPEMPNPIMSMSMPISAVNGDPHAVRVASKQAELQSLLQQLYQAEAAVKMETGEVSRTQQVAQEAEENLEEAANKVRMLSADLQVAQEAAASAAMRAHTAQLQLAAHDQLMFTARQKVDALSAQMVSVQAELASAQQMFTLNNSTQLLEQQGRLSMFNTGAELSPNYYDVSNQAQNQNLDSYLSPDIQQPPMKSNFVQNIPQQGYMTQNNNY